MKNPKSKYANDVRRYNEFPQELIDISAVWTRFARGVGDVGSCVLGAGFLFKYNKKWYFMHPRSPFQGSCSWERNIGEIEMMLNDLGCTDIKYDWGNMD